MDFSPLGSSVHGVLQARILEWVAMPSSRNLPNPGIEPAPPALQADSLPAELSRKPFAHRSALYILTDRLFCCVDKMLYSWKHSSERGNLCAGGKPVALTKEASQGLASAQCHLSILQAQGILASPLRAVWGLSVGFIVVKFIGLLYKGTTSSYKCTLRNRFHRGDDVHWHGQHVLFL